MKVEPRDRGEVAWRRGRAFASVLAGIAGLAIVGCTPPDGTVEISRPTTSSSTIVDLPAGPVSTSAGIVETRLRAAGVRITAIDRENGFITARSRENRFVDCGQISQVVDGQTVVYDGNAPRLVVADALAPGRTVIRQMRVQTSAGIGITRGVTNTVVVRQEHLVELEIRSADGRQVISSESREFTDRGFARFSDGTVCRSSNAMNEAIR